jgi:AcrR family transcriptional regulator
MDTGATGPVSRRGQPPRLALSRAAIIEAGLRIADRDGLDAVTMRRVATVLQTSASALYVYVRGREDLLDAMFDQVLGPVVRASRRTGSWRDRLAGLLMSSVQAAGGHGGLARIAYTKIPAGENARAITQRVTDLLGEGQVPEAAIPAALDLLALFVTAAALDRVPDSVLTARQHRDRLRWQIDVILTGLTATWPPPAAS